MDGELRLRIEKTTQTSGSDVLVLGRGATARVQTVREWLVITDDQGNPITSRSPGNQPALSVRLFQI
jgi:hypothetical protein